MEKVYKKIVVTWLVTEGFFVFWHKSLTVENSTKENALFKARCFGYKDPKWWQFWKPKAVFFLA